MGMNCAFARLAALGLAAGLTAGLTAAGYAAEDFPPPIVPETAAPSPAEGAAPAAEAAAPAPAPQSAATSSEQTGTAPVPERDVRIEQKRIGRRVSEVIVTPAGFTYHYTMIHLEGQDSGSLLQPHPELSVPRFFRIDF